MGFNEMYTFKTRVFKIVFLFRLYLEYTPIRTLLFEIIFYNKEFFLTNQYAEPLSLSHFSGLQKKKVARQQENGLMKRFIWNRKLVFQT